MDKMVLIKRLSEIIPDLDIIVEARPSANDCVGWAQNAIDNINKLIDDIIDEGKA